MKIDIKINTQSVIMFSVISLTFLLGLIFLISNASNYYEYNKYISDNQKSNIDFYYNCDSTFNSVMYNCPSDLQYKNLTGYFCNGTKICENSYKIK